MSQIFYSVLSEILMFFLIFSAQHKGAFEKSERKRLKGIRLEKRQKAEHRKRAPPPQRSKAAERAATSARPDGPSEESCRNKCRQEERMLRAKRASSPERLARSVTAVTSEQRSFSEQWLEQSIRKAVFNQKRLRAVSEPGHS